MSVVVEVAKLRRNVFGEFVSEIDSGGEAVPDACLSRLRGGEDAAVLVETITDIRADFVGLGEGDSRTRETEDAPHSALRVPETVLCRLRRLLCLRHRRRQPAFPRVRLRTLSRPSGFCGRA